MRLLQASGCGLRGKTRSALQNWSESSDVSRITVPLKAFHSRNKVECYFKDIHDILKNLKEAILMDQFVNKNFTNVAIVKETFMLP